MKYERTSEFNADLKKLKKKYQSLDDDIENMQTTLLKPHFEQGVQAPNDAIVELQRFCNDNYKYMKIKKFTCKSLKNKGAKSGIRVIFVLQKAEKKITFIEIYYKGDKENEDKQRLKSFVKTLK
jgi:mRNA-degrading endonuclease RelE of RelBE toxin-antitoxin system